MCSAQQELCTNCGKSHSHPQTAYQKRNSSLTERDSTQTKQHDQID